MAEQVVNVPDGKGKYEEEQAAQCQSVGLLVSLNLSVHDKHSKSNEDTKEHLEDYWTVVDVVNKSSSRGE